jgi:hypothetical protein
MKTIYVLLASKQYDATPKVLRAFHTEADAIAMKELIDACHPSRAVEVVATQLDGQADPKPFPSIPAPLPNGWPLVTGTGTAPSIASSMADACTPGRGCETA